jgi:hypothetical protein
MVWKQLDGFHAEAQAILTVKHNAASAVGLQ